MEDDLKRIIEQKTHDLISKEIILPVLNNYSDEYDERCYSLFTQELADIFEEYFPEYFDNDYFGKVGQYFYSSFWGDYIPTNMLVELIHKEVSTPYEDEEGNGVSKNFMGLEIYFSDRMDTIKYTAEDAVANTNLRLNIIKELVINISLNQLNKK